MEGETDPGMDRAKNSYIKFTECKCYHKLKTNQQYIALLAIVSKEENDNKEEIKW